MIYAGSRAEKEGKERQSYLWLPHFCHIQPIHAGCPGLRCLFLCITAFLVALLDPGNLCALPNTAGSALRWNRAPVKNSTVNNKTGGISRGTWRTNGATVPRSSSTALIPLCALSQICWLQELGISQYHWILLLFAYLKEEEVSGWQLCKSAQGHGLHRLPPGHHLACARFLHCCGVQQVQHWPSEALLC